MGGKACKNCETRRYGKDEYFAILAEVQQLLKPYFPHTEPVIAYRNKEDFGDLDLLVESSGVKFDIPKMIQILFDSKEIVPNGKVFSFEFKQFQIDLIFTPSWEFEFARHYYAYNDLGNLMGRIAHKFGMKYGHDGLYYMFRDGTRLISEICVSMNIQHVFKVFDFNYDRWTQGFDDLEDIYEFVSRSKYFNPDIYLFDQMNHRSRVRDQKRSTYNGFLRWCDSMRVGEWEDQVFFQFTKDKDSHLPFLFDQFPGFKKEWFDTYHMKLEYQDVSTKFNGNGVSVITDLQGKELGRFIQDFKKSFGSPEDFRIWVITSSFQNVENRIMEHFKKGDYVPSKQPEDVV
jgi:hypothetical protein